MSQRKEGIFRERGSNFSLNFSAIGPSNSGVVRPKMAMDFGSKEVESRLMKGLSMDSPHTIFGSPGLLVGLKMSMCYLHKNLLECVENIMLMD